MSGVIPKALNYGIRFYCGEHFQFETEEFEILNPPPWSPAQQVVRKLIATI